MDVTRQGLPRAGVNGDVEKWKREFTNALESKDFDSLNMLLISDSQQPLKVLEKILNDETWIFTSLCRVAADKVIERLLTSFTLDVNMTYEGVSALQIASSAGNVSVVQLLLNYGAKLKKTVWDEDSEFYLATLHGHDDVIKIFLTTEPDLIKDLDVSYSLFHAACKGGHLSTVHSWFTPCIDVNKHAPFISTLDGCEFEYPLFAACQGGHYDVALFLMVELNARVTKEICTSFPKMACQLIRDSFRTSSHNREQTFFMSELGIDHVESQWFKDMQSSNDENNRPDSYSDDHETKIFLSKNKLSSIPSGLIWQLSSLIELDLSNNPLTELPDPGDRIPIHTNTLTSLSLSHCHLEQLNICIFQLPNLEKLDVSHNRIESLFGEGESSIPWKCRQLKTLNLSYNALTSLPSLQECVSMELLDVRNNVLTALCSPWQCPLISLNISHNEMYTFPASCDQFWAETLHSLDASHNCLSKLHESMVKMNVLKKLDVSHNSISSMPRGAIWSCPLIQLDLSHNRLGIKQSPSHKAQQASFIQRNYTPNIELPPSCLAATLNELFLNNNDLHSLPHGLCHLQTLAVLNIENNPNLTSLPLEMGILWNLLVLKADGIKVDDKETQSMINALNEPSNKSFQTYNFILAMEQRRRECMHHDLIKMVVFGCKNSPGQCIVQKLIKRREKSDYKNEHKTLCVSKWKIPYSKKFQTTFKRDLTFQTWEFPVCKEMSVAHQCFLTENSLYLIVHNAYYDEGRLEKVSQQIAALQASVSKPCIIVVCVFLSSNDDSYDSINQTLEHEISTVKKCHYVPFIFDDKSSLDLLLRTIYSKASQMPNSTHAKNLLVDRKVPKSFIGLVDKMKNIDKRISTRDELLTDLGIVPSDLQDTVDRQLRLQEYLLQVGAMLYYNVQMGDLWNLVILDPVWLYDVIDSFMKCVGRDPKVGIERVEEFAEKKIGLNLFPAFIALLEFFNIGMRIEDKVGMESLFIPSFLPEQSPTFLSGDISYSHSTSRLYCLPAIPSALWSRIISQLIPAFDRFTDRSNSLPEFLKWRESCDDTKKSFRRGTRRSQEIKGLCVKNKGIQFWASGIMVWHDRGLIVVEEVSYEPLSGKSIKGILVTVKCRDEPDQSPNCSHKELAAIGVITDELEEILELFNPMLMEYMQEYHPIALCPNCHKVTPGQGVIKEEIDHFQINVCAQKILWDDYVFCDNRLVCLSQIMPEFMFLELPTEFRIQFKDLEFMDEKLGQGMVGSVIKGRFKQTDVAIKSFYVPSQEPVIEEDLDPIYPNVPNTTTKQLAKEDRDDTELKKISNAFLDLRREVSVLSKLKHKCIITFLGVCVKRQLLLVLELAPLGSFRSCLEERKAKNNIPVYKPTVSDPIVVTKSVFEKDLTYKILLQVSSGLSYLHKQSIIFRDLKPDNILVLSLELDAEINVKVSDYGISRFSTARGVSGFVGTPCYMAPEVLAKQTYTNKVDVYSLGIVMFEAVSGVSPVELYGTNQQPMVSQIAKTIAVPRHVKLFKVCCNFPFLEGLMEECWSYRMDDRPSVREVIRRMSSDQFLLLHDVLWADPFTQHVELTYIYTCQTGGRPCIWISESVTEGCLRLLSVYDVMSSTYTVRRKRVSGPRVLAMAKVRDKIWLISEDSKQVEEIVRSTQSKFEVKKGTSLDVLPSCLVCHMWKPANAHEDHAFVMIGHVNGSITASHVQTQQHKTVTTTTVLNLDTDYPILNILTVSNDCLIVSAGHSLYRLDIQEQLGIDGLFHPSISVNASFSLHQALRIIEHIDNIEADADCVWCSFDLKNELVRFNWKEQSIKSRFMLFINTEDNIVDIMEDNIVDVINKDASPPSNPVSSDTPPPRPPRRSKSKDDLGVKSLCLVRNLLAVGTDAGGLFLLPTSGISQNIYPLQLPLLHHPEKRKEDMEEDNESFRSHSDSVTSARSMVQNSNIRTSTFSVPKIVRAGNDYKVVSVLKLASYESVLRKRLTLPRRQAQRKRTGGVYAPDNDYYFTFDPSDYEKAVSDFQGNMNSFTESQSSMTNCAEIAVWDFVSDARLKVLKGYRKGFC